MAAHGHIRLINARRLKWYLVFSTKKRKKKKEAYLGATCPLAPQINAVYFKPLLLPSGLHMR